MKDEGGGMKDEGRRDLKERTREFALRIVRCYAALPRTTVAQVLGKQMLRAGTSVGAHYREGVRSRSDAEFVSKLDGALQELEETCYWLELLAAEQLGSKTDLASIAVEADELTAILVTCVKKVKARVRGEG